MSTTRRGFLGATAGAAAAFTIVPAHVLGGPKHVAPSDRVNVALVGAGGQGRSNLRELFKLDDVQVIAVADPAERWDLGPFYYKGLGGRLPILAEIEARYGSKSSNSKAVGYEDFRELLEKEKAVDAVLCATPDHLHAYVSLRAMRAGKHVYCEKPLTHNIAEARLVAKVAAETKVATQLGNQGHSAPGMRQTIDWLKAGVIGPVKDVHAWVGTSRWNPGITGRPADGTPAPEGLNWDLWLGPREERPFHKVYAPVSWRDFWSFGSGALGDFGCHDLDAATWALDLKYPTRVEATPAGPMDREIAPYGSTAHYQFPARGDQPPVALHWYDGGLKPLAPEVLGLAPGAVLPNRGVLFVGEKGAMLCGGAGGPPRVFPGTLEVPAKGPAPRSHHRDWVDAIKSGEPAGSNFAYGARLTEIVLLGVAALRLGKPLEFNAADLTAKNVPEAEAVFHETYRKGWELT